jgi:hypothetical protein
MNICDDNLMCHGQRLLPAAHAAMIMSHTHQTLIQMTGNTSMNLSHGLLPGSSSTTKFHTATGDPFVRLNLENETILSVVHRTTPFYGAEPNIKIWPQSSRLNGDLCARVIVTGGKQAHRLPKKWAKAQPTIIERKDSRPDMAPSYEPSRSIVITPDPQRQSWDLGPLTLK